MTREYPVPALVPTALLLAALALLLTGGPLAAHPHAWIDLRVSLLFSEDGRVSAMRQEWSFDPTYSHLLLEDMAAEEASLELATALQVMAKRMLDNLQEYGYFTELKLSDQRLLSGPAREGSLHLDRRRLHLQFKLPLDAPRPNPSAPLTYRVYDPTYWIEILHDPGDVVHLAGGEGCSVQVKSARPEAWLVAYAATLNRDQRAPIEDLGQHFAEVATITCNPR